MANPAQRLLIVDDDRDIRQLLAEQMTAAGYLVCVAADGAEMRRQIERNAIDLVVLDLNLRGEDGLSLCRELRARSQTPVIMLTARGEAIDRILGLEMGADDYVPKPFEPRELLARVRNVLRRTHALPPNLEPAEVRLARFAGWLLDFESRQLQASDGRISLLSGAEFRLLSALVRHPNRVLSREQLLTLSSVRSGDSLDRAIDLQISRVRQKFGSGGVDLIRTVRHEGYVLAAKVVLE